MSEKAQYLQSNLYLFKTQQCQHVQVRRIVFGINSILSKYLQISIEQFMQQQLGSWTTESLLSPLEGATKRVAV